MHEEDAVNFQSLYDLDPSIAEGGPNEFTDYFQTENAWGPLGYKFKHRINRISKNSPYYVDYDKIDQTRPHAHQYPELSTSQSYLEHLNYGKIYNNPEGREKIEKF